MTLLLAVSLTASAGNAGAAGKGGTARKGVNRGTAQISSADSTKSTNGFASGIELKQDKTVIHVNDLNISHETLLIDLLSSIPELLDRDRMGSLSNYDIQLDGRSLGNARDIILTKTRIYELESIEISSSPVAAQQRNGQGGVINLKPSVLQDGLHGDAFLGASTLLDVIPSVNLGYSRDKLQIRGQMSMEYYSPTETQTTYEVNFPSYRYSRDTVRQRYIQEVASISLQYKPTGNDQLKLWFWENWRKNTLCNSSLKTFFIDMQDPDNDELYRIFNRRSEDRSKDRNFSTTTYLEYKHIFNRNQEFVVNATCATQNTSNEDLNLGQTSLDKPLKVDAEMKFKQPFALDDGNSFEYTLGVNGSYSLNFTGVEGDHNRYISPFLSLKYAGNRVTVDAGVRYQNYYRRYSPQDADVILHNNNDFTWNVNLLWQIAPHHSFRAIANRNLVRPSDAMLFFGTGSKTMFGMDEIPNPDLQSSVLHSFEASYIHDWRIGKHGFVTSVSFLYDYAENLIEKRVVFKPLIRQYCTQYVNTGVNNIYSANAMLNYYYGIFSIVLTGNYYYKWIKKDEGHDYYTKFNFCIKPSFNFKDGWIFSCKAEYNGPIYKMNEQLGDCFYAQIELNKVLKNWTFAVRLCDVFDYSSTDRTLYDGKYVERSYDFYYRNFQIGATYKF